MTRRTDSSIGTTLSTIPVGLRTPLLSAFSEVVTNFGQQRWEPSELNGGKLCEIVYTILRGHVDGSFAAKPAKPTNMVDACRALEHATAKGFPRSVCIQIPRMMISLYEIRNNRGVGHAGGDVDPNHMDAVAVLYMAKWIMSELVRLFHAVDTTTATAMVDAIAEREMSLIWVIGSTRRVLDPKMTYSDKTLVLLYREIKAVREVDLFEWVEHPRASDFRKDVLLPLHAKKLIEYVKADRTAVLSPLGIEHVEYLLRRNGSRSLA